MKTWAQVQKTALFLAGLGFAFNELILRSGQERPYALVVIAWMLGAPLLLPSSKDKQ